VRVGLFRDLASRQVLVMGDHGPLAIWADGKQVASLDPDDGLMLRWSADGIIGKSLELDVSAKESIVLRSPMGKGFRLRSVRPRSEVRDYPGSLEVRRAGGAFTLVATVPLEEYVGGVVQSEAGKSHDIEYYKLQAVSCRTYALANARRHAAEGFEVCDGTHCQVFRGRNVIDTIRQAVTLTRNLVVVDADIQLIHATFHSNCGGETMDAQDLWSTSEPYLVSTVDTFCLHAPHATWRRAVLRSTWLAYLKNTFGVPTDDPAVAEKFTNDVPLCRDIYLANGLPEVPVEKVRADMGFRSAFFSMHSVRDSVIFDGRGFGHGVGLCQEGAMQMARDGLPYTEILHHYFAEVHLVDLNNLDFFRDDGL
jgi:stage II sporulation protein D